MEPTLTLPELIDKFDTNTDIVSTGLASLTNIIRDQDVTRRILTGMEGGIYSVLDELRPWEALEVLDTNGRIMLRVHTYEKDGGKNVSFSSHPPSFDVSDALIGERAQGTELLKHFIDSRVGDGQFRIVTLNAESVGKSLEAELVASFDPKDIDVAKAIMLLSRNMPAGTLVRATCGVAFFRELRLGYNSTSMLVEGSPRVNKSGLGMHSFIGEFADIVKRNIKAGLSCTIQVHFPS